MSEMHLYRSSENYQVSTTLLVISSLSICILCIPTKGIPKICILNEGYQTYLFSGKIYFVSSLASIVCSKDLFLHCYLINDLGHF